MTWLIELSLVGNAMAKEIANPIFKFRGLPGLKKLLHDGGGGQRLENETFVKESAAVKPSAGLEQHPTTIDAITPITSFQPRQQGSGTCFDVDELSFGHS